MSDHSFEPWEQHLYETASAFRYPATPDLARLVSRELRTRRSPRRSVQRLAWALVLLVVLMAGLMAVPPVRAQILEFLQVGIIRIFLVEPTPTPTATPAPPLADPGTGQTPTGIPRTTPTRTYTPTPRLSVLDLLGETSLEEARDRVAFPVLLPTYPEDLGAPDRVFLQDLNGQVLVLVWLDPDNPDAVRLSLHTYSGEENMTGEKIQPRIVQETSVKGLPAVWAVGPYLLRISNGDYKDFRMIQGHVLIWAEGEITYRLETDLALEEAVRVAESLQPLEPATPSAP